MNILLTRIKDIEVTVSSSLEELTQSISEYEEIQNSIYLKSKYLLRVDSFDFINSVRIDMKEIKKYTIDKEKLINNKEESLNKELRKRIASIYLKVINIDKRGGLYIKSERLKVRANLQSYNRLVSLQQATSRSNMPSENEINYVNTFITELNLYESILDETLSKMKEIDNKEESIFQKVGYVRKPCLDHNDYLELHQLYSSLLPKIESAYKLLFSQNYKTNSISQAAKLLQESISEKKKNILNVSQDFKIKYNNSRSVGSKAGNLICETSEYLLNNKDQIFNKLIKTMTR